MAGARVLAARLESRRGRRSRVLGFAALASAQEAIHDRRRTSPLLASTADEIYNQPARKSDCDGYSRILERSAKIRLFAVGAVCFVLGGCAARAHPAGLRPAHLERLYFGRNIGDTAVVSDSAWSGFLREVLTPAFPEGATVWDAAGQWQSPDGTQIRERSFVVELVHLVTPDVEARVQRVMEAYKRKFAQQSVLRMVTNTWVSF